MVSRAGRMSSASSHFESQSVKLSTHRFRVFSHPFGDSVSVAVLPSTSVLYDSGTADALVAVQSFFNVDSTVTTCQLVEVRKNYFIPLEYELHVPLPGYVPVARDAGVSTVEKCPSSSMEAGLKKRLWKATAEQPADASGSTARTYADKGKGTVELREVPERGYTMRELCDIEDRGALHPTLAKQVYECSSEELMNWTSKSVVWIRMEKMKEVKRPPL
ncbi:hypothetical protein B296_00027585 [Ensete ventricosum]|uniref:Uncharacterized protein n=1 Tax=Ensete ventricosum TaxID=4639 RepID=A0A427APG8_ENSVE|nr:hypothetical protein B296_00027585 [Ensete ventricosum]